MRELQRGLYSTLSATCDTGVKSISISSIKEALKLVLIAVRTTKRLVAKCESFTNIWDPTVWTELHHLLAAQERFMASAALVGMCRQVIQLVQTQQALPNAAGNKRKADAYAGVDARAKKTKRVTAVDQGDK